MRRLESLHRLSVGLVLASVSLLLVGADVADEDGSRMRAPEVAVPSDHSDELTPPDDEADWRYIALESPTDLSFTLEVNSGDKTAKLTVRRASGETLFDENTKDGTTSYETSLEPGIFYIGVTSDHTLSYSLTIE